MTAPPLLQLGWADWLALLLHFASLSLLSIGGAIATAPDMHRYLVIHQHWLTDAQFASSIAIAQAAPGPNVLFVALLAWNLGINSGSTATGLFAVLVAMTGILLPSTTLAYATAAWAHRNRDKQSVRAFKTGMAPVVIGLLIATSWILGSANRSVATDWPLWLLSIGTALLLWKTPRVHVLMLLAAGALLGWFGLV